MKNRIKRNRIKGWEEEKRERKTWMKTYPTAKGNWRKQFSRPLTGEMLDELLIETVSAINTMRDEEKKKNINNFFSFDWYL